MKLPEGRKERIQMLAFAIIVTIIVLYLGIQLGLRPMLQGRKAGHEELAELQHKMERAEMEFRYLPRTEGEHATIVSNVNGICLQYVLQPVLGSYLIGVTEPLESMARLSGFEIGSIGEVGFQSMPQDKKKDGTAFAFRSYSVQVSGVGSYEETVDFSKQIEERNPYLCVSSIDIVAQKDNPERHRVVLRLDWPIWAASATTESGGEGGHQP